MTVFGVHVHTIRTHENIVLESLQIILEREGLVANNILNWRKKVPQNSDACSSPLKERPRYKGNHVIKEKDNRSERSCETVRNTVPEQYIYCMRTA